MNSKSKIKRKIVFQILRENIALICASFFFLNVTKTIPILALVRPAELSLVNLYFNLNKTAKNSSNLIIKINLN